MNSGTWLQRLWWRVGHLYQRLKPCRASVIITAVAYLIFTHVDQGIEILRTVGEGSSMGGLWEGVRIFMFFAALALWAISNWYVTRVLLYFDFSAPNQATLTTPVWTKVVQHAVVQVPRLLGVASFLIIAYGFLIASRPDAPDIVRTPEQWSLVGLATFSALLAAPLYLFFVLRRRTIGPLPSQGLDHWRQLGRETIIVAGVFVACAFLLFIIFTVAPVAMAQNLGMGIILFLALASWVNLGGLVVVLSAEWRMPLFGFALVLAIVSSFWNDNHGVRVVSPQPVERPSVLAAFNSWYAVVEKNYGVGASHPLYIVSTEGGGIRAAYWTALVLGALQDQNPNFSSHVFAISGVSGGSLGATVFDALLAEPASFSFKEKASAILRQDFLSPALAAMLYPDLVQRFIPIPISYLDRARALEAAWEKAWRDTMGNNRFAGSFVDLFKSDHREWIPALFLNGTSVEKGSRVITSNLQITNSFLNSEDAAIKLAPHRSRSEAGCDIPVSTAVHMSARFTFVSPSGRFPDGSHIVDGGYFENSGTATAEEIARRIEEWCMFKQIANVYIKIVMISNDPESETRLPWEPPSASSSPSASSFLSELMTPVRALEKARVARAEYAQYALVYHMRRFRAGMVTNADSEVALSPSIFRFKLRRGPVPFVLGWMLSDAAAKAMEEQLYLDDDIVQNKKAINDILKTLPPTQP